MRYAVHAMASQSEATAAMLHTSHVQQCMTLHAVASAEAQTPTPACTLGTPSSHGSCAQRRGDLHAVAGREAHEPHALARAALHANVGERGARHEAARAAEQHLLLAAARGALVHQANLRT